MSIENYDRLLHDLDELDRRNKKKSFKSRLDEMLKNILKKNETKPVTDQLKK